MRPTRRQFLSGMVSVSGVIWMGCGVEALPSSQPGVSGGEALPPLAPNDTVTIPDVVESGAFPLGVAAGELAAASAIVWTRYQGARQVGVSVYQLAVNDRGEPTPIVERFLRVTATARGFVRVQVEGLVPGARYRYVFWELDGDVRYGRSRFGQFRAALAPTSQEVLTIGATSCIHTRKPFSVLARAAARTDLDLFLYVGDALYCDDAETLDQFNTRYREYFTKPEYAALRASCGMGVVWDDHEVTNNWDDSIAPGTLSAAKTAFVAHHPVAFTESERQWRSQQFGLTAEVFYLDCRGERTDDQYISSEQMAWLKQALAASRATFKLIVNSVPITRMPMQWKPFAGDRWEGYGAQRSEILNHIADAQLEGVLWISGDFHLAFIGKLEAEGRHARQYEVLVGPGAQRYNPLPLLENGQFRFVTKENNYATFRLDPAQGRVTIAYVDGAGTTLHERHLVIRAGGWDEA